MSQVLEEQILTAGNRNIMEFMYPDGRPVRTINGFKVYSNGVPRYHESYDAIMEVIIEIMNRSNYTVSLMEDRVRMSHFEDMFINQPATPRYYQGEVMTSGPDDYARAIWELVVAYIQWENRPLKKVR